MGFQEQLQSASEAGPAIESLDFKPTLRTLVDMAFDCANDAKTVCSERCHGKVIRGISELGKVGSQNRLHSGDVYTL